MICTTQQLFAGREIIESESDYSSFGRIAEKMVQYFEMFANRGIWADGWKAVTHRDMLMSKPLSDSEWELYHMAEDFSECHNLAEEKPDKLRDMINLWWVEAGDNGVLPIDLNPRFPINFRPGTPHATRSYTYYPPISHIPPEAGAAFGNRSWNMTAEIQRLKESGNVAHFVGMDIKKVGFHLAKVEIAANNIETVVNRLSRCPHFLNGFMVSGKKNLCILLIGEDISTLEALVEHHVRTDPEVSDAIFNVVTNTSSNFIIPITLSFEKGDIPPCGRECKCETCSSYESGRCTGCPASEFYRGTFWS